MEPDSPLTPLLFNELQPPPLHVEGEPIPVDHMLVIAVRRDGAVVLSPATENPEELAAAVNRLAHMFIEAPSVLYRACGVPADE